MSPTHSRIPRHRVDLSRDEFCAALALGFEYNGSLRSAVGYELGYLAGFVSLVSACVVVTSPPILVRQPSDRPSSRSWRRLDCSSASASCYHPSSIRAFHDASVTVLADIRFLTPPPHLYLGPPPFVFSLRDVVIGQGEGKW